MYNKSRKNIDESSLLSIIKSGDNFIELMMQMAFMDYMVTEDGRYYFFIIDSLTDFLIARSLFNDISGRNYNEQVEIIKDKSNSLYNLKEALIIAIFDNMSPDYKKIRKIMEDTGLINNLNADILVKIHFKSENINDFLKYFEPRYSDMFLKVMGGYTDKPFNCCNFLFDYYCENRKRLYELSDLLSGIHFNNEIKKRLKNILYFINITNKKDRRDDEAFYFALLCCAAPNKDIRCLAMKLLYDITYNNNDYIELVIEEYRRISDFYIKEAAIYVLSQMNKKNSKITTFFNQKIA